MPGEGILELRQTVTVCTGDPVLCSLMFPLEEQAPPIAKDGRLVPVGLIMEMQITPPWGNPFETVESVSTLLATSYACVRHQSVIKRASHARGLQL
jgi:hypothetical protein